MRGEEGQRPRFRDPQARPIDFPFPLPPPSETRPPAPPLFPLALIPFSPFFRPSPPLHLSHLYTPPATPAAPIILQIQGGGEFFCSRARASHPFISTILFCLFQFFAFLIASDEKGVVAPPHPIRSVRLSIALVIVPLRSRSRRTLPPPIRFQANSKF